MDEPDRLGGGLPVGEAEDLHFVEGGGAPVGGSAGRAEALGLAYRPVLARPFPYVQADRALVTLHLRSQVPVAGRELANDPINERLQLQRPMIDLEPVKFELRFLHDATWTEIVSAAVVPMMDGRMGRFHG